MKRTDLKGLSIQELKGEISKLEDEISVIKGELDIRKKLNKPYRYKIQTYNRTVEGGNVKYKTTEERLSKYINQDRVGTGLIYLGYTYKYLEGDKKELNSLMFKSTHSVGLERSLEGLNKLLGEDFSLQKGFKYEDYMVFGIIKYLQENDFNPEEHTELLSDFMDLGAEFDKRLDEEEHFDKKRIVENTELTHYDIKYVSGKVVIRRKD